MTLSLKALGFLNLECDILFSFFFFKFNLYSYTEARNAAAWEGVVIDAGGEWGEKGRVLALELDAKFKFTTFPPEILRFTAMKELLLTENGLTSVPGWGCYKLNPVHP